MQETISLVQALIERKLGNDAVALDEGDDRFHPEAVNFFCDEPSSEFAGFSKNPFFETNIVSSEVDDDHLHRVERHGRLVIYTAYERDPSRCTYHAAGQALVCELGSDAEQVFLANAAASVLHSAADPLRSAIEAIRNGGVPLSPAFKESLIAKLFG